MLELLNNISLKRVGIYIGSTIIIVIFLFTIKNIQNSIINYRSYKKEIKQIQQENKKLLEKQKDIDDFIINYEKEIKQLDYKLSNIKEKTTIIKEYYKEKNKEINNYNINQIDSFFKNRYNY